MKGKELVLSRFVGLTSGASGPEQLLLDVRPSRSEPKSGNVTNHLTLRLGIRQRLATQITEIVSLYKFI